MHVGICLGPHGVLGGAVVYYEQSTPADSLPLCQVELLTGREKEDELGVHSQRLASRSPFSEAVLPRGDRLQGYLANKSTHPP